MATLYHDCKYAVDKYDGVLEVDAIQKGECVTAEKPGLLAAVDEVEARVKASYVQKLCMERLITRRPCVDYYYHAFV